MIGRLPLLPIASVLAALMMLACPPSALAGNDTVTDTSGLNDRVDRIVIEKALRKLTLLNGDRPVRSYQVALGAQPRGHKRREGDQRTPEGVYSIDARNPNSDFFLSLRISYPNDEDLARARAQGQDPGGQIMIHGLRNGRGWIGSSHQRKDWTDGCVAVTNSEMLEIWRMVDIGTLVEIKP
jgi:murein L,D-transpeptidase YafK